MIPPDSIPTLIEQVVHSTFDAYPSYGRASGDHDYDGRLGDVGRAAVERRTAALDGQATALAALATSAAETGGLDAATRADLATTGKVVDEELFQLRVLRSPASDPQWAVWRGCDVGCYIMRDYAPAHHRAEQLAAHLERLPEWLSAAAELLDPELAAGPRDIAVDALHGHASFYRDEGRRAFDSLADPPLERRLDAAVAAAVAAVDRHADRIAAIPTRDDWPLGAEHFIGMLRAQEGVEETVPSLRARVDAEMAAVTARGHEVAGRLGADSLAAAFATMEADHPARDELVETARSMLADLRTFWRDRDVVSVPEDVDCVVRSSPSFFSFITAAFDAPGYLDPPGLTNYYYVTPVDPRWSDAQADDWLRHLNNAALRNISVHEVYPGHFVHSVSSRRDATLLRNCFMYPGFAEGWAHYTELLAIEEGLAAEHPWLELAMIQDALLRCGRFSATVGMHTEGRSLDWATEMMQTSAHIPRLAAEREALRGTWDPMYLSYTYGKLEILRWRSELQSRPGYSARRFHDRMIGGGSPPLAVMRDYVVGAADEWLGR